ncbi:hypothetical protein OQA88_6418 [Cercophora sp. LCS_1]
MAPSLLHPPSQLSPGDALQLSQQAPSVLQNSASTTSSSPFNALLSNPETADQWVQHENLLLSCLRTGDEVAANRCLEKLLARFSEDNERVMALRGLVKEAEAQNNGELEKVLHEYDQILSNNNTNIPITKRRIALLRSMGRLSDAVSSLVQLLDFLPTDAEAWSELADLYLLQGMYQQAIYATEEVLVLAPNAWNVHARLGEILYMAATAPGAAGGSYQKYMTEAVKRFSRSIELCDDYLRGYYGLKLVTNKLLKNTGKASGKSDEGEFTLPDTKTTERLNQLATSKLSEIIRRSTARETGWRGYDELEVEAARKLLSEEASAASGIER